MTTLMTNQRLSLVPERGHFFPFVHAMSGWGHEGKELITIEGRVRTEEMDRIAETAGHSRTRG
jgi:hypothetical protein